MTAKAARRLLSTDKTPKQKWNLVKARLAYLRRAPLVPAYPVKLTIDPCNYCNLHCAFCPVGQGAKGRQQGVMTFELFQRLIDECGPYLWTIDLFNWGEPLLNADLCRMVSYARERHIDVVVSSNMNRLSDTMCRDLVESDLSLLICSVDGASQETTEKYQRGTKFGVVMENMRSVIETRNRLHRKRPLVQWRFVVNRYNESEIPRAREMAEALGVDIFELAHMRCDMGKELLLDNAAQFRSANGWLPEDQTHSLYDYATCSKRHLRDVCRFLWLESVIHPRGEVSPCCAVWHESLDFGSISSGSFMEVWNGAKYLEARRIIRGDEQDAPGNICAVCKRNKALI